MKHTCIAFDIGSSSVRAAAFELPAKRPPILLTETLFSCPLGLDDTGNADAARILFSMEQCLDQCLASLRKLHQQWTLLEAGSGESGEARPLVVEGLGFTSFAMSWLGVDERGAPVTPIYTYARADPLAIDAVATLRAKLGAGPLIGGSSVGDHVSPHSNSSSSSSSSTATCTGTGDTGNSTSTSCARLRDLYDDTGAPLHAAYAPSLLAQLALHEPQLLERVSVWQTVGSWCLARWCGLAAAPISTSEASWSGLLDLRSRSWHRGLVCALDLHVIPLHHLDSQKASQNDGSQNDGSQNAAESSNADAAAPTSNPTTTTSLPPVVDFADPQLRHLFSLKGEYRTRWPELCRHSSSASETATTAAAATTIATASTTTTTAAVTGGTAAASSSSASSAAFSGATAPSCRIFLPIGDGAAAALGSGCVNSTRVALSVGTSAAARVVLPAPPPHPSSSSPSPSFPLPHPSSSSSSSSSSSFPSLAEQGLWCYVIDKRRYLLGGALTDGGSYVAWLRQLMGLEEEEEEVVDLDDDSHSTDKGSCKNGDKDTHGGDDKVSTKGGCNDGGGGDHGNKQRKKRVAPPTPFTAVLAEAAALSPQEHGLSVLPFLGPERSTGWHSGSALGCVAGLRKGTTRAHLLRAALDSVAVSLAEIVGRMAPYLADHSHKFPSPAPFQHEHDDDDDDQTNSGKKKRRCGEKEGSNPSPPPPPAAEVFAVSPPPQGLAHDELAHGVGGGGVVAPLVASGGALAKNPLWRQLIADACGRPLLLPHCQGLKSDVATLTGVALLVSEALGEEESGLTEGDMKGRATAVDQERGGGGGRGRGGGGGSDVEAATAPEVPLVHDEASVELEGTMYYPRLEANEAYKQIAKEQRRLYSSVLTPTSDFFRAYLG